MNITWYCLDIHQPWSNKGVITSNNFDDLEYCITWATELGRQITKSIADRFRDLNFGMVPVSVAFGIDSPSAAIPRSLPLLEVKLMDLSEEGKC